jgi:WD40 repeat protein
MERLLTVLDAHVGPVTHADIAFSPDGHLLAPASGNGQVTIWNVTRPAHGFQVVTITGSNGYFQAIGFSPQGNMLAGATTAGTVLVYSVHDSGHPVLTAISFGLAAQALPGREARPGRAARSCPGCMVPSYALAFGPGGLVLIVALDRITISNSSRDTAFSWPVTASGNLTGGTSAAENRWDGQPALGTDGRTIVDGSAFGRTAVGLWELPVTRAAHDWLRALIRIQLSSAAPAPGLARSRSRHRPRRSPYSFAAALSLDMQRRPEGQDWE